MPESSTVEMVAEDILSKQWNRLLASTLSYLSTGGEGYLYFPIIPSAEEVGAFLFGVIFKKIGC